jgi:hypothetical protein
MVLDSLGLTLADLKRGDGMIALAGPATAQTAATTAGTSSSTASPATTTSTTSAGASSSTASPAAASSTVPSWLLCPPLGASGMEPFIAGTNLSCAP